MSFIDDIIAGVNKSKLKKSDKTNVNAFLTDNRDMLERAGEATVKQVFESLGKGRSSAIAFEPVVDHMSQSELADLLESKGLSLDEEKSMRAQANQAFDALISTLTDIALKALVTAALASI